MAQKLIRANPDQSANSVPSLIKRSTIGAARRASIGMEMQGRCSCVAGYSLFGYEIVEGRLDDGRVHELRRVNYAPGQQAMVRGE